ncbi:MAG: hypothetical protein HUU25_06860 [Candidatus Sumerlaeia bacterium]|nr:hypothetical protein [Candidatus Sumerlaeia bacterium]
MDVTLRRLLTVLTLAGFAAALLTGCSSEADRLYRRAKDAAREDNDYEAAVRYVDQAIALMPDEGRYHRRRGDWLRELDRNEEALESYDRAAEAGAPSESAFAKAISLCLEMGRLEEAQERIERARLVVEDPQELEDIEELAEELAQLRNQAPPPEIPATESAPPVASETVSPAP